MKPRPLMKKNTSQKKVILQNQNKLPSLFWSKRLTDIFLLLLLLFKLLFYQTDSLLCSLYWLMRGSCHIQSVEIGVEFSIIIFFLIFSFKKIRSKRSKNHSYWALKLYLFWVKAWRCPKKQNLVAGFLQLKKNKKQRFKIWQKFRCSTPISTLWIWHDPLITYQ